MLDTPKSADTIEINGRKMTLEEAKTFFDADVNRRSGKAWQDYARAMPLEPWEPHGYPRVTYASAQPR